MNKYNFEVGMIANAYRDIKRHAKSHVLMHFGPKLDYIIKH